MRKNAKHLRFWAFWAKMANFGQFLANFFFKKALGTFFLRLQALTNCKVSKKSNERTDKQYSHIWPNLGQIWVTFGQNGSFFNFPKKKRKRNFFDYKD